MQLMVTTMAQIIAIYFLDSELCKQKNVNTLSISEHFVFLYAAVRTSRSQQHTWSLHVSACLRMSLHVSVRILFPLCRPCQPWGPGSGLLTQSKLCIKGRHIRFLQNANLHHHTHLRPQAAPEGSHMLPLFQIETLACDFFTAGSGEKKYLSQKCARKKNTTLSRKLYSLRGKRRQ